MKTDFTNQADQWFQAAEQKAADYFSDLQQHIANKTYSARINNDLLLWKKQHVSSLPWLSWIAKGQKSTGENNSNDYIRLLNSSGKLDAYLDRSISYIYLRDLGKALSSPVTQTRIQAVIADTRARLLSSQSTQMTLDKVYRWAQKEKIENTIIWVLDKLAFVSKQLPKELNPEHAQRKLIKIIVGVVMHVIEDMSAEQEELSKEGRSRRLAQAIRLGYAYGLTYPFIDDLLDSDVLNKQEKNQYTRIIRSSLLTGVVPELGEWKGDNKKTIQFIHSELKEAFEYIRNQQQPDAKALFFEQSYLFFHFQDIDRVKELTDTTYSNEDLYLPVIGKSASSRLIVRSIINASEDVGYDERTFYYGIYNQLSDDFTDLFDDLEHEQVTPYTYYYKYHAQRPDLINPFELYLAVISYLIHDVYHSDAKTREVILDRAINGLKRSKERLGTEKYNELMAIFAPDDAALNHRLQFLVKKAKDVDFLDKLLRDEMVNGLTKDKEETKAFLEITTTVRDQINDELLIPKAEEGPEIAETIFGAANYSLTGDGKRLRPILAWVIGVKHYGISEKAIRPLLKSLEYLHTASLIFDDLPSQDNSSARRGRPTLHELHDSGTAELSGLFLIQKAIEEQSSLAGFDSKSQLAVMQYSSRKAQDLCIGQAMDLHSKGKELSLEELNTLCFYKTGVAFEASLVMPAMLAQAPAKDIEILKSFAYHAGIAFQIKDDLLDQQSDQRTLGKPVGQDAENNTSTFVTILGQEGATHEMWEHYCLANEALDEAEKEFPFLKRLMEYIVQRAK
ncbi:polyprenyl synthetase family protein [Aureibacillus halotolerans]|uniref:Geranylgeranyl pyrophosphate synthase n=1 Tax=Aureibacillus halotolerans TaxID=1508390 RepID=A0A4V3D669_9BACI|nr:polyprenyl synthetase family protein [Aureibacillus halotolerans]TDQ42867.1 geranylgeranyl pyrophosphate synthase [Aureibacillus halotolerans]